MKTRFVDKDTGYPLFEAKQLDARPTCGTDALPDFDDYDLVLVADFGHGLLETAAINREIARHRRAFVSAMAQVNSSNYGYNLPTKYVGADYYSLNRTEAELCLHEQGRALPDLVDRMAALLGSDGLSVTDGANGAMVRVKDERFAAADAQHQRGGHHRLRRRLLRAQQPGVLPAAARADGGARRQHRRRGHGAAALQRAADHRAGIPDHRQDRHMRPEAAAR